ncbi:MAG: type II CAAX endopeptidase family protein [Enhygromyxa sp.]
MAQVVFRAAAGKEAAETAMTGMATETEPIFQRGRHLALAVIGLAHALLVGSSWTVVLWATNAQVWSAQQGTINSLIQLCFAALVAWFAFTVFDTHAGVTIWPKRWRDIGWPLAAWCLVQEVYVAASIGARPAERLQAFAGWIETFTNLGELQLGWLVVSMIAAAAAEEIVYRALLLRALEGYMNRWAALVMQAAVFELVHAYVYGDGGITGVWFIGGLVLGYAFQRTRSLALPTLLHAAHNILFFTLVWVFNQ